MDVFSNWIEGQMATGITWAGHLVGVALLTQMPTVDPNAPAGLADLLRQPGYKEVIDPHYTRATSDVNSITSSGGSIQVVIGENVSLPTATNPVFVVGAVYYLVGSLGGVTNPWIFVSNQTFRRMVYPGSQISTADAGPNVLFSYFVRSPTAVDTAAGAILRSPGNHPWEPPHVQHVYLYPERVNWVPNPSFEDVGNFGWRSDGTITRLVGGVDNPSLHYGHCTGTRVESIGIPGGVIGWHHVSAYIRATSATQVAVGLACWDMTWTDQPPVVMGPNTLIGSTWTRVDALVEVPDATTAIGFSAMADGAFDIDLVLVEATGDLNDYFDGDSQTGFIGDFSWQGIEAQSLSFWYNNRNLVGARLFGDYVEGVIPKRGLVYDWVPEGTAIYTHWDVLSPIDTKQPLQDFYSKTYSGNTIVGHVYTTLANFTANAVGKVPIIGTVHATVQNVKVAAFGKHPITGRVAAVMDAFTAHGAGEQTIPPG